MNLQSPFRQALHIRHIVCLITCAWAVSGCASLPPPSARPATAALPVVQARTTALGRLVQRNAPSPDVSGFRLLVSGDEAMSTLIALADHAQSTLDMQYYLIRSDGSAKTIMRHVRAAADRGVRVRLLVDDLNTAGQDEGLMRLTMHPHIEVRLYNPLPAGRLHMGTRLMAALTDFKRINHRMHNKMFVADNTLAVTGGRNLGDPYFLRDKDSNFLDVDVLAAGPAVQALSATFDRFWNDPLAYPVSAVADVVPGGAAPSSSAASTARALTGEQAPHAVAPPSEEGPAHEVASELAHNHLQLNWVAAHVLADKPAKMDEGRQAGSNDVIDDDIQRLLSSATQELVIISPYFVPGPRGMALFRQLRQRGVAVRVLTNSLATTDAPAVHIGYARYRTSLLDMGVQLYELKADLHTPKRAGIGSLGSSRASLHAKVIIVDRQVTVVGSMNLDPRSSKLNTEMGVVMRSPAMAAQLIRVFDEVATRSYALSLTPDHDLQWRTQPPDPSLENQQEPGASTWLRLSLKLLAPLAPEEML